MIGAFGGSTRMAASPLAATMFLPLTCSPKTPRRRSSGAFVLSSFVVFVVFVRVADAVVFLGDSGRARVGLHTARRTPPSVFAFTAPASVRWLWLSEKRLRGLPELGTAPPALLFCCWDAEVGGRARVGAE